jgi:hypothetical protein
MFQGSSREFFADGRNNVVISRLALTSDLDETKTHVQRIEQVCS